MLPMYISDGTHRVDESGYLVSADGHVASSLEPGMQRVHAMAAGVAATPTTVLLTGESGTGKEVLARSIHQTSSRRNGPFVAINCAAVPATLMESEFFGHERGAFSGAGDRKQGLFELADGGTLLLDEISELPRALQAKLLRVIQERQVCRLGGTRSIPVDVRIIATTNRNLTEMVAADTFRQDLYYRINVFPIELPPLRDRKVDLPALCRAILTRLARRMARAPVAIGEAALRRLMEYDYPGNVRELQNLLERALILSHGATIGPDALMFDSRPAAPAGSGSHPAVASPFPLEGQTLAEIERGVILNTLARLRGNRTRTSEALGISIRTLRNRLASYRGAGFRVTEAAIGVAA